MGGFRKKMSDETWRNESASSLLQSESSGFKYRVTIELVTNLLLTSKQMFRFGRAGPSQAKTELVL